MKRNPSFNDNRLKLGVFGHNVSNGCAITTVAERHMPTWENTLAVSQAADTDGFEAIVPVARWRGFGGPSDFNGTNFETYTWAAGLAQATNQICVMTTSHVPTVHPLFAAKQAATVDHISGGRFALNIVCGWFKPEFDMFGTSMMNHDDRYEYAAEWLDIVKMLWSRGDEFDFEGKFFNIKKGFSMPKPLKQPPPIMNAGGSGAGQRFAAKYADMAFILVQKGDSDATRRRIKEYRDLAFSEFGREIQIWCNAYVVHGDTQKEADDYLHRYVVEMGTTRRSTISYRS